MEKLVVQIKPKEGIDLDGLWKYWNEVYAPRYLSQRGLVGYEINRYKKLHGAYINDKDNPGFLQCHNDVARKDFGKKNDPNMMWGMEEFWWESRADYYNAQSAMIKNPEIKSDIDYFNDQLAWSWSAWVEERVIVDSGYTELVRSGKDMVKLLVNMGIKDINIADEFWRQWITGHTQRHLSFGVRRYCTNRIIDKQIWEPSRMFAMPELYYDSEELCEYNHKQIQDVFRIDPEGKRDYKDFHMKHSYGWGLFVENKAIKW